MFLCRWQVELPGILRNMLYPESQDQFCLAWFHPPSVAQVPGEEDPTLWGGILPTQHIIEIGEKERDIHIEPFPNGSSPANTKSALCT